MPVDTPAPNGSAPGKDVFLSFQSHDEAAVRELRDYLEAHGISCWICLDDSRGIYAAQIMDALDTCRAFVVVIGSQTADSNHAFTEISYAFDANEERGLPFFPYVLEGGAVRGRLRYPLGAFNAINVFAYDNPEEPRRRLVEQLFEVLPDRKAAYEARQAQQQHAVSEDMGAKRTANLYFEHNEDAESSDEHWLHMQNLILKPFDQPIFDRLLAGADNVAVLDIGCSSGEVLHDRLGTRPEVTSILGVDANEAMVARARERFADDPRCTFMRADCESDGFTAELAGYLAERGISGFDFVSVSMVLLHLKNPYAVFDDLLMVLNPGARIFVRDIDDGLNVAYPDDEGIIGRLNELCDELPTTGFRASGRQVYQYLNKAGFEDIRLERSGLSTVGMSRNQRVAMYMTCFDWLGWDLEVRCRENPDNERFRADRDWFEANKRRARELMCDPGFFYQEGFVTLTARAAGDLDFLV